MILSEPPTDAQVTRIRAECSRLQREMFAFLDGVEPAPFDGTIAGLIRAYQTDPDGRYPKMAYKSRLHTDHFLAKISAKLGSKGLKDIGARDFIRLYAETRWPDEGKERIFSAHATITAFRMMIGHGVTFELAGCTRLKEILSGLEFENGKASTEAMTLRQCEDVIAAAHRLGFASIALTQAIQFDLGVRQKDAIGQWLPLAEPGISHVPAYQGRKWLSGMRWEEISSTMLLQHPASKTGKMIERNLSSYPMVMAEIDRIPQDRRAGPLVICELTGRPWKQNHFRMKWRECAVAAGLPANLYNMHSRAGRISETIEATGSLEFARKEAQHSKLEQTARYSRRDAEIVDKTAALVLEFRNKNRA